MAEGLLTMSVAALERSHVVRQAVEDRLSQQEGAERLGIGVRQFKRLVRTWKRDGALPTGGDPPAVCLDLTH